MSKIPTTTEAAPAAPKRTDRYFYATGKRKTSVAQVRLYEKGHGDVTINNHPLKDYFFGTLIGNIFWPLKLVNLEKSFDIVVNVEGGGKSSQADAIRHGISRALLVYDSVLRATLKRAGLISRDSRVKERKKYGLKGARRAPQWAKR